MQDHCEILMNYQKIAIDDVSANKWKHWTFHMIAKENISEVLFNNSDFQLKRLLNILSSHIKIKTKKVQTCKGCSVIRDECCATYRYSCVLEPTST